MIVKNLDKYLHDFLFFFLDLPVLFVFIISTRREVFYCKSQKVKEKKKKKKREKILFLCKRARAFLSPKVSFLMGKKINREGSFSSVCPCLC